MPLYEYECETCHKRTEKIMKFKDAPLTVCPYCGGHLERTITAPAVQFAGGGWYKDLYSSAKPKTGGSESASADSSKNGSTPAADATASKSDSGSNAPAATPAPAPSAPAAAAAKT